MKERQKFGDLSIDENIKLILKMQETVSVDSIHIAQDRIYFGAVVGTLTNVRISYTVKGFIYQQVH
jgi:hypothetical protein